MQERSDGLWSLPGGWADPLDAPSEAVMREIREETGYGAEAVKLAACWDRDRQGHLPPLPVHAYKLFFICRATGVVEPPDALETLDVGWFDLDGCRRCRPAASTSGSCGACSSISAIRAADRLRLNRVAEPTADRFTPRAVDPQAARRAPRG